MTTDWFHGTGAFNEEELKEFIEAYEQNGRHNWQTEIIFSEDELSHRMRGLLNELTQDMGRLQDRLALTIIDLSRRVPRQHSGDCAIYASLINDTPEAGVCTWGYGLQVMRKTGDHRQLYSRELMEKLMCVGGNI